MTYLTPRRRASHPSLSMSLVFATPAIALRLFKHRVAVRLGRCLIAGPSPIATVCARARVHMGGRPCVGRGVERSCVGQGIKRSCAGLSVERPCVSLLLSKAAQICKAVS